MKFGRLTVVGRAPDKISPCGKHKSCWYCNCECGTENKIIVGTALTSGATKSCGCLHKEISSETAKTKISHGKKYNKYNLTGDFGIGYTSKGEEFYFDLDDYDKIKDICWNIDNRGYVVGSLKKRDCDKRPQSVRQHRLINEPSDWQVVDHINGCKNDNRKKNLRNVRQSDNTKNRSVPINNTSGHIGVSKRKDGKWSAYIGVNNKTKFLGNYNTFIEAVDARVEAENKYFNEYRRKNEKSNT